jgi:hypothetical protein
MATPAHPRTITNAQTFTRGQTASDWTRFKRLNGAKQWHAGLATNVDVNVRTIPQTAHSVPMLIPKHTGASRIRRTTGQWTDFIAWQHADWVSKESEDGNPDVKVLHLNRLCNCTKTNFTIREAGCPKCAVYVHKTIQ